MLEAFRQRHPDKKILLTFFSPSGYEIRKNTPLADYVFYLPLDTPRNARRFLDLTDPCAAVFVKYEFWYFYLTTLKKRGIPTYLVSARFRPEQPFFRKYGPRSAACCPVLRIFSYRTIAPSGSCLP